MDQRLQAKLLRAIQEREIDRVGGTQPIKVDIRLIATSNRDLELEVKEKRFREDLYFRLNVVNIVMPPLRERPADIVPLAEHFADKYSVANGIAKRAISSPALGLLQVHHWRGNVRELENTMHRAVLLARGVQIEPEAILLSGQGLTPEKSLPANIAVQVAAGRTLAGQGPGSLVGRTVADVERDLIIDTLNHCLGNRTHAANILGISIRTLRNKLKQYGESGAPIPTASGEERVAS
jgi:DNA-binding NtrC family response regulator